MSLNPYYTLRYCILLTYLDVYDNPLPSYGHCNIPVQADIFALLLQSDMSILDKSSKTWSFRRMQDLPLRLCSSTLQSNTFLPGGPSQRKRWIVMHLTISISPWSSYRSWCILIRRLIVVSNKCGTKNFA